MARIAHPRPLSHPFFTVSDNSPLACARVSFRFTYPARIYAMILLPVYPMFSTAGADNLGTHRFPPAKAWRNDYPPGVVTEPRARPRGMRNSIYRYVRARIGVEKFNKPWSFCFGRLHARKSV